MTNIIFGSPLCTINYLRSFSTNCHPLYFRVTEVLLGEPLKKKKRLDPNIIRAREERKRKKLEKQIRVLEKHSNHMKPILEIDMLPTLINAKERARQTTLHSSEEIERRALLYREWTKYKHDQWQKDVEFIKSFMHSQEIALKELKAVSNELYKSALEIDDSCLPYNANGPLHTMPIEDYVSPDGEYTETTVKYARE